MSESEKHPLDDWYSQAMQSKRESAQRRTELGLPLHPDQNPVGQTDLHSLSGSIGFVQQSDRPQSPTEGAADQGFSENPVGHFSVGQMSDRNSVQQSEKEEHLNAILNAGSLSDTVKAFMVASAKYDAAEVREEHARQLVVSDDHIKSLTAEYYAVEKARSEARRLVAAENYTGSEELTWDDLEQAQTSYLVEDLVPDDSVVFLVAKRNIGKTFAYIDMVLSMQFGMKWLGKETRAAKTLIVLGEGRNGYIDRIRAWCDFHSVDMKSLKDCLFFMNGANLNNDESIERIRAVADREQVELLIFDTWATASGAESEDDAALNSVTLNRAASIRPGATYFYVHHPRKSEQDTDHPVMRGSGALDGRAEVVLTMYRDKDFIPMSGEKAEWLALSTEDDHGGKNRTAPNETIRGLYLDEQGDSGVFRQIQSESMSRSSRRVQEKLLRPMTAKQYAQETGSVEKTAKRHLDLAVQEGVATVQQSQAANVAAVYVPVNPNHPNYAALHGKAKGV